MDSHRLYDGSNTASALGAAYATGHYGAPHTGITLSEQRPGAVYSVFSNRFGLTARGPGDTRGSSVGAALHRAPTLPGAVILPLGPNEAVMVGPKPLSADELSALGPPGGTTVFDLSHARTLVRAEGEAATNLLNKGCPLDFSKMASQAGASTVLGPFSVVILRRANGYDVLFSRSYARSGFEWLLRASHEFGCEVLPADDWGW